MPLIVPRTVASIVHTVVPELSELLGGTFAFIGTPAVALFDAAATLGAPSTSALTNLSSHLRPLAVSDLAPPCPSPASSVLPDGAAP